MSELSKPFRSLYSPCDFVTESCFEHFMHFQFSAPGAKQNLMQICCSAKKIAYYTWRAQHTLTKLVTP
jgi:hypothetical protein